MFYTKNNYSLSNVILVISCCFLGVSNTYSQFGEDVFDLRLQAEMDCGTNELTTTLQIRAQSDTFKIGTSSVLLKYDISVLNFSSYQSINFDVNSPCFSDEVGGAWSAHAFDGTVDGFFNLTLNLNAESFSCPVVDTQWIDIGLISFTVEKINDFPNFQFDLDNSTFNRSSPNNGEFAPEQGDLMPYNVLLATACACEPPTLRNDTLDAGCPTLLYETNIFNNDIVSNPSVTINTNPTKGTATINPNGMLTYVATSLFCGEDQFTYQVCNDDKEECCSEATVIIRFSDETPPFFPLNIPVDTIVACGQVPDVENLLAADNCPEISLVFSENRDEGNCRNNAIIVRTWTATDICGNSAVVSQVITVIDTLPPVFSEIPQDITVSCDSIPQAELLIATNNCEENSIVNFLEIPTENECGFTLARTWKSVDSCGNESIVNQTITVVDEIAPTIECPADETVNCSDINSTEIGEGRPIITDNCDESENVILTFSDEIISQDCENKIFQQIRRVWKATDRCGNFDTCVQIIFMIDDIPPVIDCPADFTINCGQSIDPEINESIVFASDNCSSVTVTFQDSEIAPTDCNFNNKMIFRTWVATDDCGNIDTCVQKITIIGEPCPEIIILDSIINICSGTELNLRNHFDLPEGTDYEGFNKDVNDFSDIYSAQIGCEIVQDEGILTIKNEDGCIVRIIHILINIYPAIEGTIIYRDSGFCKVVLLMECAEFFQIDWKDDKGHTGVGTDYMGVAGESGFVTFYVHSIDSTLLDLPCAIDSFFADYSCPEECPPGIQETITIIGCEGDFINLRNRLQISTTDRIESDAVQLADLEEFELVAEGDTCGVREQQFFIIIFDENNCPIREVAVLLIIAPSIKAVIIHEDEFCRAKLELACPEKYKITWEDNAGNTGEGMLYEGAAGESGFVKFFIECIDESILELVDSTCLFATFETDYSCPEDCPEPVSQEMKIVGCHGDLINLFERLDLSNNIRYEIDNPNDKDFEDITSIKLENEDAGCSLKEFRLTIRIYDEKDCLIRIIFLHFEILPRIIGEVAQMEERCGVRLELNCPELYQVVWEDDADKTGDGPIYEAAEGTSGEVRFHVTFKDSSFKNIITNPDCLEAKFSGEYGCCKPAGTACDDGNEDTFGDQEDGECGCEGVKCEMENKGKVFESGIDGCGLLIEMGDGTILEPAQIPTDFELVAGQEIVFSFVELIDIASICQRGKIVEIICIENTCPEEGTPCTDGDLATINDKQDGDCNCIGESVPEVKSEIDLRFRPRLDCETNTYCVAIQAKAVQQDFFIGTSSILVKYNADALEFMEYTSTQFDEMETCIGGNSSPWEVQKYDGISVEGEFDLTLSLIAAGSSCPEIQTNEWETIGILCFDIMDNESSPDLKFDKNGIHFNRNIPNDGTAEIKNGKFNKIKSKDALFCTPGADVEELIPVQLAAKACLQGPYQAGRNLMADDLRKKELIPLKEPYTEMPAFAHVGDGGGEVVTSEVLGVSGENAIVDWVFLELRSASDSTNVVATRSALLQRDGDIVEIDGVSPVGFNVPEGQYYVCVKHRNHLGVMPAAPILFEAGTLTSIDFTDPNTLTFGENAQLAFRNKMFLWGGNANPDKYVILAGGGLALPDRDMIFFDIFLSLWYANPGQRITYNSVLRGYYNSDTNLDGKVKYQGPKNDIDALIFFNVLFHPSNTKYRLNFVIAEQIP